MRSTAAPIILSLLVACGDAPNGTPPQETDTGSVDTGVDTAVPTEGPQTWHLSGQVGQVFAVNKVRGVEIFPTYSVQAMFADNLQGVATAAWCQSGGPCVSSLPAAGTFVDGGVTLDAMASAWAWNGHTIEIGSLMVPFSYNATTGLAWYSTKLTNMPDTSPVDVSFDGEWGKFSGEVVVPEPLDILSPDPEAAIPLDSVVTFQWTPTGEDDVYLRVVSGTFDRLWHLEDDGSFDLEIDALGIGAAGDAISISLQRWNVQTVDVNGNELLLVGIWDQPFLPLVCEPGDYPNAAIPATGSPQQPLIDPASVAVSFQAVIDDEKPKDFWLDEGNDGSDQLFSAVLVFDFFDDLGAQICTIVYDASSGVHVGSPTPISGAGVIFDAWDVNLANGNSTCTALDQLVWGRKDLREILQMESWGFGIGTVAETEDALTAEFTPWATYEPLMAGAYIKLGTDWHEIGGTLNLGMEACGVVDPNLLLLPKPTGSPLPLRMYSGLPVVSFPLGQ